MSKAKRSSPRIDKRQVEQRRLLVDQLRKIPIIQVACEKVGVSRATYYRWTNEDPAFATEVDTAIMEGTAFINDMAESQLIAAIKDQNFPAISFWLRHRHKAFADKLQVEATVTAKPPELGQEEAALVADALRLLGERRQQILNETTYAETKTGQVDGNNGNAHAD